MTNFTMPNIFSDMTDAKNQSLAFLMLGSSMGVGMAPELQPDVWKGQEKVLND